MDGLVFLTFVVGAISLQPKEKKIVLEWSWASDLWFIFEGFEDFVDREFQRSKAFHRSVVWE